MGKYKYVCIVIYLLFNSLEANVNVNDVKITNNLLLWEMDHSYPSDFCTVILDEFAQCAANFTLCSITNARPIRLCENCINEYVNFTGKYKQLLTAVENGTSCRSYFTSQDRFDVILEFYNHIMTVWNKGYCNDCFDFSEAAPRLSNNTIRFNEMAKDTLECIKWNSNITKNNTEEVCETCMEKYLALNEFYGTLSKDSIGVDSICMDTVDLMNATRSKWSKDLNCCRMRQSPEVIFLVCTGMISLLPFLFYIVVRYFGPLRDLPNILKESRFKQSILRRGKEEDE